MNMPDIIGFLLKMSALGKRKEVQEIIYEAEESSVSGMQNYDILKYLSNELKGNAVIDAAIKLLTRKNSGIIPRSGIHVYLDPVINLLSRGKARSVAYRNILSPDVISMLKVAEARGVTGEDIFKTYGKMQPVIAKAESQMRSALAGPTVTYMAVSLICYFTINTFYKNFSHIPGLDLSAVGFIRNYYLIILAVPLVAVHYVIRKYPDIVPIWSKVYKYTKGAELLLITKTLFDCGMSSIDAIYFFRRLGNKKILKEMAKLKKHQEDMGGLSEALSYYLSQVEIARLKASVIATEQKKALSKIVAKRMMSIEETVSGSTALFSKLLTVVVLLPVGLAGFTLATVISGITQTQ